MPRTVYVEQTVNGRRQFVRGRRASSERSTTSELLEAAEQREASLTAENIALRNRLSVAERDAWQLRNLTAEYHNLANEHHQCRYLRAELDAQIRETRKIEDKLDDEKDRVHKMSETLRRMKPYKEKYEEKWNEVELLKRGILERDDLLRLEETRIADKTRVISYLKQYLRNHGFRVD